MADELRANQQGRDLIDYALIIAMMASAAAGATAMAVKISQMFVNIGTKLAAYTS